MNASDFNALELGDKVIYINVQAKTKYRREHLGDTLTVTDTTERAERGLVYITTGRVCGCTFSVVKYDIRKAP
jgi:hypothetical protein